MVLDLYKNVLSSINCVVDEDGMIFPVSQYIEERYVARILSQFPYDQLPVVEALKVEEQMQIFENEIGIHYDDLQKEAIHQFFSESFMILTGGPGTGKTTVVGAMIHLFKRLYPSYSLACIAPTGRAAKRLSEINEVQAEASNIENKFQAGSLETRIKNLTKRLEKLADIEKDIMLLEKETDGLLNEIVA